MKGVGHLICVLKDRPLIYEERERVWKTTRVGIRYPDMGGFRLHLRHLSLCLAGCSPKSCMLAGHPRKDKPPFSGVVGRVPQVGGVNSSLTLKLSKPSSFRRFAFRQIELLAARKEVCGGEICSYSLYLDW